MAAGNKKALDAPTGTTFLLDPFKVRVIGLDTPHKSRKEHILWDPRIKKKLLEQDIQNVLLIGVKEPILVCKDGDDFVDVIDGGHRTRWLREVNKRLAALGEQPYRLESKLWRPSDPSRRNIELLILKNSLNSIRRENDPLEEAEAMQAMLAFGASEEEVLTSFGDDKKSPAWMKNRLALLELDGAVIDVIKGRVEGKVFSYSAAARLSGVSREEQVPLMEKLISEGRATAEEARREVTIARESRMTPDAIPADNRRSKPDDSKPSAKTSAKSGAAKPEAPKNDHAAKPKMVIINRLLALEEIGKIDLSEMTFIDCLKWMLGQKESSRIAGLNACLKLAEKPVKKPAK